ncbi:hypothetical protein HZS_4495, partial [Henneguya salminicola]
MDFDKKRRSSILKINDGEKKNDVRQNQKRKRVSFATEEILHRFNANTQNSKSSSRFDLNQKENEPSTAELERLSKSPLLGSSDLQNLFTHERDSNRDSFNPEVNQPLNIADKFLAAGNKIRRSQIGSVMLDNSLNNDSSLRRSPRIRNKNSKKVLVPLWSNSVRNDISEFREPSINEKEREPTQRILDLEDITFLSSQNNKESEKNLENPQHFCADMDISTTFLSPVEQPQAKTTEILPFSTWVDTEICLDKAIDEELKSVLMDTSSMNDIDTNYSMLLVKKTKQHQEKILNLSQDLRSVLNMSISECMDIVSQSSIASSLEKDVKKIQLDNQNVVKFLKMKEELNSVKKFITLKVDAILNARASSQSEVKFHFQLKRRAFHSEFASNFDVAKSCLVSKFIEFDNIKNTIHSEYSELINQRDFKQETLVNLKSTRVKSYDLFTKIKKLYKKYNVHVFPLNEHKFKIYAIEGLVDYLIECDQDLNVISCTVNQNSYNSETFYRLLNDILCEFCSKPQPLTNINEIISHLLKINKIFANFKLLYSQLDAVSLRTSQIKYDLDKIGFMNYGKDSI